MVFVLFAKARAGSNVALVFQVPKGWISAMPSLVSETRPTVSPSPLKRVSMVACANGGVDKPSVLHSSRCQNQAIRDLRVNPCRSPRWWADQMSLVAPTLNVHHFGSRVTVLMPTEIRHWLVTSLSGGIWRSRSCILWKPPEDSAPGKAYMASRPWCSLGACKSLPNPA
jgi:hypothetical protein